MVSAQGRYIVTFNGEIYNHHLIRRELESAGAAPAWQGHSDTEVLLAAVDSWGLAGALRRFIGMFAFALWDTRDEVLTLVRDRLGEKPLYYGRLGNSFLFASELKSLRKHRAWTGAVWPDAVASYLRFGYVPAPYSIYQHVYKLTPGTLLSIPVRTNSDDFPPAPMSYWAAKEAVEAGAANPFRGSASDAVDCLESLLIDAIKLQRVADVPLGAFLSGGVDSSTIVALMQRESDRPVKTFSIGFEDQSFNEAKYAKAVANQLHTEHTELYISSERVLDLVPRLPVLYDEPLADSSQIPTFLVSKLARQHVTVSLSGDAGDELFGGYNRYYWNRRVWSAIGWIPAGLRSLAVRQLTRIPVKTLDKILASTERLLPGHVRLKSPGEKLLKNAGAFAARGPLDVYIDLISHWKNASDVVVDGNELPSAFSGSTDQPQLSDPVAQVMFLDLVSWLPDDILAKVDRAAMAVSLETRIPLLDHRIVEFAWTLPLSMKIRNGESKWILRQVLHRYVPEHLVERPKMGFSIPLGDWLRGMLREWAEGLLDPQRIEEQGFLKPGPILQKWREHLAGQRNWQYDLWDILMFQAWAEEYS